MADGKPSQPKGQGGKSGYAVPKGKKSKKD